VALDLIALLQAVDGLGGLSLTQAGTVKDYAVRLLLSFDSVWPGLQDAKPGTKSWNWQMLRRLTEGLTAPGDDPSASRASKRQQQMAKKRRGKKQADWAEAKKRCRLNAEEVRMAKEMGLSPRSLIKNVPPKSEPWKAPVKTWVREMYEKRQAKAANRKQRANRAPARRAEQSASTPPAAEAAATGSAAQPSATHKAYMPSDGDTNAAARFDGVYAPDPFTDVLGSHVHLPDIMELEDYGPPDEAETAAQSRYMEKRQRDFRLAAERIADAFGRFPSVCKVVLLGSVAVPLHKEVPRFRRFRRAGIAIWHECSDVDLAVWVTDLADLRALRKTKARTVSELYEETEIGVASHQVDVFIVEPGTDQYLGRLCEFAKCPSGTRKCRAPGCGNPPFLRQHAEFTLRPGALDPSKIVVLFTR